MSDALRERARKALQDTLPALVDPRELEDALDRVLSVLHEGWTLIPKVDGGYALNLDPDGLSVLHEAGEQESDQ